MKKYVFNAQRMLLLIVFITTVIPQLLLAQKNKQPLFNGKDLAGWKKLGGTATYAVDNGMIVGTTVMGSGNTFLTTVFA